MLRKFISWRLSSQERTLGESLDYVRHIMRVSLRALFKFAKILPLSQYRRKLPADAYFVAKIVATRDEDCGSCVQIEVNLAKQAGVASEVIQAVVDCKPETLTQALADVYRFAEAVVKATGEEDDLREKMREHFGEEGLVEIALAMASCRVFPITKRALGYAKSCKIVEVKV